MCDLLFKFGIHNKAVKLYIIEKETGKRKNKSLSFFLGKSFKIQTSIEDYWNAKNERFKEEITSNSKKGKPISIDTAKQDNKQLEALKRQLEELASTWESTSIDSFLKSYEASKNVEAKKEFTLFEYSEYLYKLKENGEEDKIKTTNYQLYKKFYFKLQGKISGKTTDWANNIKRFANKPISQIDNKIYQDFASFCVDNHISKETIRYFCHVVYHYQHEMCKNNAFRFDLKKINDISKNCKKQSKHTAIALTDKQWNEFLSVDLKKVFPSVTLKSTQRNQLLYDSLLLLYHTASRPIDVISMKIEDIDIDDDNIPYWEYTAHKLTNYKIKELKETPQIPLSPEAMKIIEKYKGNRKKGYLLPFSCNINDNYSKDMRSWKTNHYSTDMGVLLQTIAKYYGWKNKDGETFTSYSMRKTKLTHMRNENFSYDNIAYIAQTSEKELKKVYVNRQMNAKKQIKAIYYKNEKA